MISNVLSSIDGIEIYPLIAMIIFIFLFAICLIYIFRLDKNFLHKMGNLPLETINENDINEGIKNE